jgi:predicted dehydrogenase
VEVWATEIKGETGIDVSIVAQLKFANGVVAQISSGFRSPFREGVQIVGSEGKVSINEPWKPHTSGQGSQVTFVSRDDVEEIIEIPHSDPYQHEVEAMEACVLDGAEPVVPLSLSRDFLRSVLAIYESAATGQSVKP